MTHEPTHTPMPEMIPTCCFLCGRRANGLGIGRMREHGDLRFVCDECGLLAAQIKAIRRFDHYEQLAVTEVVEKVGPMLEDFGTDLGNWTSEQAEAFVVAIILGFGDSIRTLVREREVPF